MNLLFGIVFTSQPGASDALPSDRVDTSELYTYNSQVSWPNNKAQWAKASRLETIFMPGRHALSIYSMYKYFIFLFLWFYTQLNQFSLPTRLLTGWKSSSHNSTISIYSINMLDVSILRILFTATTKQYQLYNQKWTIYNLVSLALIATPSLSQQ